MKVDHPVFDGTTGRSDHGGRRTHIIRILRDTKDPLTVDQVAKRVGVPLNTARFHLESLVDAGLAVRETQTRTTPGRPKVAYVGTLPNQTHERAQGFRLLAEIMAVTVAQANGGVSEWMYQVGSDWGRFLTKGTDNSQAVDEYELVERLMAKLDALWFAPELATEDQPKIILHNCPFWDSARRYRDICQIHVGMINGALEEMKSKQRVVRVRAHDQCHRCEADLMKSTGRATKVPVEFPPPKPQSKP